MSGANDPSLAPGPANHVALTPLSLLARARDVFGDHVAIIHGDERRSWRALAEGTSRLADALRRRGIGRGDVVAMIAPNTPALVEAHFGVPAAGGVLCAINTRLDAETIAYILEHSRARILIADTQHAAVMRDALARAGRDDLLVVDLVDAQAPPAARADGLVGTLTYDDLLAEGDPAAPWTYPEDEWDAITLNYTSGTSGRPKGVLYHHRGAYLMALGTIPAWGVPARPVYLYTVPLFHCNGWCHAWMLPAVGGTMVTLRQVSAAAIYAAIAEHGVTHFGGAPVVLAMLCDATAEERRALPHTVQAMTAGAPPPPSVLERVEALGFDVLQVYGLTETHGHVVQSLWQPAWDDEPFAARAERKARQGVRLPISEAVRVIDVGTGADVPADGVTLGEVVMRGNTVMKGYLHDPDATARAFEGGVFHSGDLAVMHPDGYLEIKDRLKDVIISGGENVSSVEVENALCRHPAVAAAAVVAKPDTRWGETPCAFVELRPGADASAEELVQHCRGLLAGFKTPRTVAFGELPRNATGKVQKAVLRDRARELG